MPPFELQGNEKRQLEDKFDERRKGRDKLTTLIRNELG